jgi:ankyrin repeat protein
LLQNGANVAAASNDGGTALMLAAVGGHVAVAQLLLQNGADVRAALRDGRTALMIARAKRHEAVVRLLREHGGDQNWFRRWLFG